VAPADTIAPDIRLRTGGGVWQPAAGPVVLAG